MKMPSRLAWVGLGNMGAGMCKNIAEKANIEQPILIYDISETQTQRTKTRLGDSAMVADSIAAAAAEADIIFLSVSDDKAVLSVLDQIIKNDISGKLIVDCSTVHPDTTRHEARTVQEHRGAFVACPVFGAAAMADAGQLICVLAGDPAATERVKPFCNGVMGKQTIDLSGDDAGKATLMKIIGNTFVLNAVESLSEGHVLAEKSGLGSAELHKFVQLLFPGVYEGYSSRFLSGDYYKREQPLFSVALARKDARHAQGLAKSAGMTMKNVELADSYLEVVERQKGRNGELAAIYGAKRLEVGLPFEN